MLKWNVRYVRDTCPYNAVVRKKRKRNGELAGILLLVAALLIILFILPSWVIAVLACAVLVTLGLLFLVC